MNISSTAGRSDSRSTASRIGTPHLGAHLEQQVPRHPFEQPGIERRGQDDAVPHHEQVGLRAFGELAPVVEEYGLVCAVAHRLLHRQHVVQQVVGLDDGIDTAGVVAHDAGDDQPHPVPLHPARRLPMRAGDDDDGRRPADGGVVAEIADAPRDEYPEGHLAVRVDAAHGVAHAALQLPIRRRDRQGQARRRGPEPGEVPIRQEGLAVVGAEGLVDAVAVEKAVVEHRDHRPVAGRHDPVHVHGGLGDAGGRGGMRVDRVRIHAVHGTIRAGPSVTGPARAGAGAGRTLCRHAPEAGASPRGGGGRVCVVGVDGRRRGQPARGRGQGERFAVTHPR